MPREPRLIPPGVVVHVICRFVNDEFFVAGPAERAEMLRRAEDAARKTDWRPLHYAVMSTHSHWSFYTGNDPLSAFFHPLNTGMSTWLNRRNGRHGPVVSARPRALIIEGESAIGLGAYIHNNPPRAGVVDDPLDSSWTSHRAYVGVVPTPDWLDVGLGLELMDLPRSVAGRRMFADYVAERSGDPRDPKWSGGDRKERRRRVREAVGAPVECATPTLVDDDERQFDQPLVTRAEGPARPRWDGDVHEVIERVSIRTGVPSELLLSRSRKRSVVAARRVCLLAWCDHLGRPAVEMTSALGISEAAGSQLRSGAGTDEARLAASLADRIRSQAA